MSFRCLKCGKWCSTRVRLPDHIPTAIRCRDCRSYMIAVQGSRRPTKP